MLPLTDSHMDYTKLLSPYEWQFKIKMYLGTNIFSTKTDDGLTNGSGSVVKLVQYHEQANHLMLVRRQDITIIICLYGVFNPLSRVTSTTIKVFTRDHIYVHTYIYQYMYM